MLTQHQYARADNNIGLNSTLEVDQASYQAARLCLPVYTFLCICIFFVCFRVLPSVCLCIFLCICVLLPGYAQMVSPTEHSINLLDARSVQLDSGTKPLQMISEFPCFVEYSMLRDIPFIRQCVLFQSVNKWVIKIGPLLYRLPTSFIDCRQFLRRAGINLE